MSVGTIQIAIGVGHELVGFAVPSLRAIALSMLKRGLVNTIENDAQYSRFETATCFWFHFGGAMIILSGYLMKKYMEDTKKRLPKPFSRALLATAVTGAAVMPASGFWLAVANLAYYELSANQSA